MKRIALLLGLLLSLPVWAGYDFEGSESDYMTVGDAAGTTGGSDSSIACWIKAESTSADMTIATLNAAASASSSANNFAIGVNSSAQVYIEWETSKVTLTSPTVSTGTWYLVTGVMDAGNLHIYLNESTTSGSEARSGTWDQFIIGSNGYNAGFGEFFDGIISECGVWEDQLTSTDVGNLYNSGSGDDFANLATGVDWNRDFVSDLTTPATGTSPTNTGATQTADDAPHLTGGGSSVAPLVHYYNQQRQTQ